MAITIIYNNITIRGVTYNLDNTHDPFVCYKTMSGAESSEGNNAGNVKELQQGETYYIYAMAIGDSVTYPYLVSTEPTGSTAWYKEDVFPYATYKVYYNANGGEGAPYGQTKSFGTDLKLSDKVPARKGYSFVGWGISADDTIIDFKPGDIYKKDAPLNLFAIWKENEYVITYKPNGAPGSDLTGKAEHGKSWTTKGAVFEKIGHTQIAWNTKADGSGKSYDLNAVQTDELLSDLTLYAIYAANEYILEVDPNGGTWNGSKKVQSFTQKYGTTKKIEEPKRPGYDFTHWMIEGKGSIKDGVFIFADGNGKLTARYKINASVRVMQNGAKTPAMVWIGQNGTWKKRFVWVGSNGKWNKSSGAD